MEENNIIYKQKQFGLMDSVGDAAQGTVNVARNAVGSTISGAGSVLDSGGGKAAGGLAGAATALGAFGLPAAGAGAAAGGATGAALGATVGSIIPGAGTIAGGAIGGLAGGILGGVGTAGLVAKGGQVLGSSLTQAAGEGMKGIGDAIKPEAQRQVQFSTYGSILKEKSFDDDTSVGPGAGDALEVGMTAAQGTGLRETSGFMGFGKVTGSTSVMSKAGAGKMLMGGPGMIGSMALSAPVDKAKEIVSDSINEAENYKPTVKNSYVKQKNHSDQDFQDMNNTISEGVEKTGKTLGNGVGGAVGGMAGMAAGAAGGAIAAKAGTGIINKVAGTSFKGAGKYGAALGAIGGLAIGAQKGSSTFTFSDKKSILDRSFSRNSGSILSSKSFSKNLESDLNINQQSFQKICNQNFQSLKDGKNLNPGAIKADLERASAMMFSDSGSVMKSFAASSEIGNAAKGLWNIAKNHKGTIAKGIGTGVAMGVGAYGAKKALDSDKENGTNSALGKIALGAGATILGSMALRKGVHYKALGNGNIANKLYKNEGAIKKATGAVMEGVGFGAGMAAAVPAVQSVMKKDSTDENGNPKMSTGKKLLIGGALTAGALIGGHKLAKSGFIGKPAQEAATKFGDKYFKPVTNKIEDTKNSIFKNRASIKAEDTAKKEAEKAAKDSLEGSSGAWGTTSATANGETFYKDPKWKDDKVGTVMDKAAALVGGGNQTTQKLRTELQNSGSEYLKTAGDWMQKHPKAALAAAAPVGYAGLFGTWDLGEKTANKTIGAVDKSYKPDEDNENI